MSIIDELITDRTALDVRRLMQLSAIGWDNMTEEQRGEWMYGANVERLADSNGEPLLDRNGEALYVRAGIQKGAYNAIDLNRVEDAIQYIAERLSEHGYSVTTPRIKTWQISDIPTQDEMAQYISNIRQIRNALTLAATIPTAPTDMEQFTYQEANNIEIILKAVEETLGRIEASYVFCGQPHCGVIWEAFTE